MSFFKQLSMAKASPLGVLFSLPHELRDQIYDEVIEHPKEVCLHKVCTAAVNLKLASKRLNDEITHLPAKKVAYTCKHTEYVIRLPSLAEISSPRVHNSMVDYFITRDVPLGKQRHDIAHAKSLRFVGFEGKNVPLAVIVYLRLEGSSTVSVHGASAERTKRVVEEMERVLRGLETRAKSFSFNEMGQLVGNTNGPRTILDVRDVSNLAERLREVALQDLRQGFVGWI